MSNKDAVIAKLVTGKEWIECTFGPNGGGIGYIAEKADPLMSHLWKPDFNGEEYQQAQALALSRYCLNMKFPEPEKDYWTPYDQLALEAFKEGNIETLKRLIWEFKDVQD